MTYNSTFQDRAAQAAKAKQAALEQLRSRPPVDEKQAKARMVAGAERKTADDAAAADAAAKAAAAAPPTEAEQKAKRDERYAKRKNRK